MCKILGQIKGESHNNQVRFVGESCKIRVRFERDSCKNQVQKF